MPEGLRRALVIGAGLAGAAMCAALTRSGWLVTLMDEASGPAQGASALPVGMLSPHVTQQPTALSRLTELGTALQRAQLQDLIAPGAGWQDTEVDNHGHDPGRWPAALVRPAALVHAWLQQARISGRLEEQWCSPVAQIQPRVHGWVALDAHGTLLASTHAVVLCCAWGTRALLTNSTWATDSALPLGPVHGQLSLGPLNDAPKAPRAQRNNGVFIPLYADSDLPPQYPDRIWAMGSTYARGRSDTRISAEHHAHNAHNLQSLSTAGAALMAEQRQTGHLLGWAGVRCASADRLPLAGAWPDLAALAHTLRRPRAGKIPLSEVPRLAGLFVLTALGSRGLSLSLPCAQLVTQAMNQQSCPYPPALQAALDPARFAWRASYKPARTHNDNA